MSINTVNAAKAQDLGAQAVAVLSTPKALIGVVLLIASLYLMTTYLPESWTKLSQSIEMVKALENNKVVVEERLKQLKATDKNIGKPSVEIFNLPPTQTPELATLDIAQKVVNISTTAGNKLVSLTPRAKRVVNFDKIVDDKMAGLAPLELPTVAQPVATPEAAPQSPEGGAEGASAPAAAPAQPATPTENPKAALNCAEYQLVVHGNVQSIVQFLYQLLDFKTAIFIDKFSISADTSLPAQGGQASAFSSAPVAVTPVQTDASAKNKTSAKPADAGANSTTGLEQPAKPLKPNVTSVQGNLILDITFLVPWKLPGSL